jgi:hypothetical protein
MGVTLSAEAAKLLKGAGSRMNRRLLTAALRVRFGIALMVLLSAALVADSLPLSIEVPTASAKGQTTDPFSDGDAGAEGPAPASVPSRVALSDDVDLLLHFFELVNVAVGTTGAPGDLDTFWRQEFPQVSSTVAYESPRRFYPYGPAAPPTTACPQPPASWAGNAFYCGADMSLAWDEQWLRAGLGNFTRTHDMVPVTILAHEWGHHIQRLAGRPATSLQRELQADCYAGLYLDYASGSSTRLRLERGDVRESMLTFFQIGDDSFKATEWFAPGVHGRPIDRETAAARGFISADPRMCLTYANFEPRDDLVLGPYVLPLLPDTSIESVGDYVTLRSPQFRAQVMWLPNLPAYSAAAQLPDVLQARWDPSVVSLVGGVEPFQMPRGGTAAVQRYEQVLGVTTPGPMVHGAVFLHVRSSGGGYLFDVFAPGPAPATTAAWKELGNYLFTSLWSLQFD